MAYGVDASRYAENKRAVEEKYIGPLVKTIMTRCFTALAAYPLLDRSRRRAGVGRHRTRRGHGDHHLPRARKSSELQSNVVDLCPVGALTSKPYAFAARPWELTRRSRSTSWTRSAQLFASTRAGREVMRVLPRTNDDVNEEWISDKTRHVVDGLRTQRLDQPYVREHGRLRAASWKEAFGIIADRVKATRPARIGALAGQLAAVEEMFALKALMDGARQRQYRCALSRFAAAPETWPRQLSVQFDHRRHRSSDAVMLIGTNPRREAPVLNARIRKRWRAGNFSVASSATGPT